MTKRIRFLLVLLSIAACLASPVVAAETVDLITTQDAAGELAGWKSLLEDPNLKTVDVWTLTDGVLVCKGTPKGYIYTEKDYCCFRLTLQWRWPKEKPPGKGGVLIRMTGDHKIWPTSLEAQINSPDAGDFWGLGGYSLTGPAERSKSLEHPTFGKLTNVKKTAAVERPAGEWNDYEIVADGGTVTLIINGQQVNQATNCDVASGKILLTSEGNEIHFRNVRLAPITKSKKN